KKEDKLYKDGLITYSQLFATKNNLSEIRTELVELEKQLSNISLREEEWTLGRTLDEEDLKHEITKLEVDLENLQKEYDLQRFIFAPANGKVVQVGTSVPDFVEAGELLVELEKSDVSKDFVLDLYVPFNANALISKGMAVDVEPFIVDRNLYGWLIGTVMDVDEYVSSHNSLLSDLENQELSGLIERNGPVYKVTVELEKNKNTDSGFSWTNKKGPPFRINSGSLARSFIHVKDKAPIDYLIPIFKEYFE
ncbi:MAG: HlyD family efflux transporter periplasmic adaptor subunit, partial [Saprospiraceae bacterium]|nr:HlyD family efflux transporter periplasmic adaptor subunit [Saprospiraceae bacterium]